MEHIIGVIGGGHMGSAMIGGILHTGVAEKKQILASCRSEKTKERLVQEFGIVASLDNREVASSADILLLAVKPYQLENVISQIRDVVRRETVVVSVAAGKSIEQMKKMFGGKVLLVRAMPNTPALVGEAMSALSPDDGVGEEQLATVCRIFESFGKVEVVPESLLDVVVGVSGSSPAYVYLFIEAMADAAVADGMQREQAYVFAAQSVMGAAKMVLETGEHPGTLKDAVCSPGGTTIEAVAKLEEGGFRHAVIEAQRACVQKSKELGRQ